MSHTDTSLINFENVYISQAETSEQVLIEIGQQLEQKGLVKEAFIDNILERERNYPTGLDLQVVNPKYGNIAVPHTEGEFVNTTQIIPVKLLQPVSFNNMIQPKMSLEVSILFMILNNDPEEQSQILAQIMDFINNLDEDEAIKMFESTTKELFYQIIEGKL
ncbi:PTS sugar transporter subunit IIA [Aerococcus agrisoli]|uniref:PTS sugar transporter subunit IIA n=1 Tax=Aerococcus agrisoli TaxID=2487350 RepID=A0A3N4GPX9_9LACT|nr:PTS sugar transporter subunit IIA [Aerococcus agrisoli]RPA60670.1 PTS sugar transporter subunit IIA [Aerococcus agrisoli]